MNIRNANADDASAIIEIYNWYVLNTTITFETEPVSVGEMRKRIDEKLLKYDWVVAETDNQIIGYAYYGAFRARAAYQHTVESTIYMSHEFKGKGLGTLLYENLIDSAVRKGFREMLGVIALPNPESIGFHQKMGFTEIGTMKKVGYKFNQYIDVVLLQKSMV